MNYHIYAICGLIALCIYLSVGWLRATRRCFRAQANYSRELGLNVLLRAQRDRLENEQRVVEHHHLGGRVEVARVDSVRTKPTPERRLRERPTGMQPAHSAPYTAGASPAPAPDHLAPTLLWNTTSAPAPAPDTSCRASSYSSGGGGDFSGGGASSSWGSDSSSSSSDSGSSSSSGSSD